MTSTITPNDGYDLGSEPAKAPTWVTCPTAILIVHGIGNQLPLETLDQFGRGLIRRYRSDFGDAISISHHVVDKDDGHGDVWFDNVLRISHKDKKHTIDVYEYYWANYTENKATWKDINSWLQGVTKGAKKFYRQNSQLGIQYGDKSIFFSKDGSFNSRTYSLFITFMSRMLLLVDSLFRGLIWIIARIPFIGGIADSAIKGLTRNAVRNLTNILGDIVVYNVSDPKSKFYDVKKRIQEGAIKAIRYLVEAETPEQPGKICEQRYPSVIIAGHSLGTQIAYDAINKINLLVNQSLLQGYDSAGIDIKTGKIKISDQLRGFITFGSPLDKILFFLRETVPNKEYVRQQFLAHYNGFKQRDINFFNNSTSNKAYLEAHCGLTRHLESVQWKNYFDSHDYVSGGLDYYEGLTNVDCKFKSSRFTFTHSYYWENDKFYDDIVTNFLT